MDISPSGCKEANSECSRNTRYDDACLIGSFLKKFFAKAAVSLTPKTRFSKERPENHLKLLNKVLIIKKRPCSCHCPLNLGFITDATSKAYEIRNYEGKKTSIRCDYVRSLCKKILFLLSFLFITKPIIMLVINLVFLEALESERAFGSMI